MKRKEGTRPKDLKENEASGTYTNGEHTTTAGRSEGVRVCPPQNGKRDAVSRKEFVGSQGWLKGSWEVGRSGQSGGSCRGRVFQVSRKTFCFHKEAAFSSHNSSSFVSPQLDDCALSAEILLIQPPPPLPIH
ncbi:hypothetical protein ACJJTC_004239 [Scirpophaga incertulas]